MDNVLTPPQTIGPFFHFALTPDTSLGCVVEPSVKGERIRLVCRVRDGEGSLVTDAMIELWQADIAGFGRLATDADGACTFETVRPGAIGGQAPHINVSIFARGLMDRLVTRIYFEGDPANERDAVLALVPAERRGTLLARADPERRGVWNFEIQLQGGGETVFFDI
jgi:protocatechuate 3,4-dioxygenase, alpha subunit